MLYKFFLAQWKYPARKKEWTDQVKADLKEFGLEDELNLIKMKTKSASKL